VAKQVTGVESAQLCLPDSNHCPLISVIINKDVRSFYVVGFAAC
jgi:hypothetical protein